MSNPNPSAERTARVFGIPIEHLELSLEENVLKLRVHRRTAHRKQQKSRGLDAAQYDKMIVALGGTPSKSKPTT